MPKQFTSGRDERLKSRKKIEQLFSDGKKFTLAPFRVHYSFHQSEKTVLQFGVGVSSKVFKKAVDRNRVKRVIRESWRLQKKLLVQELTLHPGQLNIFFIYTARELPDYKVICEKMDKVLVKLPGLLFKIS